MMRLLLIVLWPTFFLAQTTVEIVPVWGKAKLEKNKWYQLAEGDSIKVTAFLVYIGKINGSPATNHYHLIDAYNKASLTFTIPTINTNELNFVIGVDSVISTSGILEGDLDPAKGMYWAWNTGYIHAKLQGLANQSADLHKEFEFHIGGYLSPYCPIQEVKLNLPSKSKRVVIYMDASLWLKGKHLIDLSKTYHVVDPGKQAVEISENYQKMFRLIW